MILERVEVSAFRNLTSVSLYPAPGLNIIEGNNASGKTSLLEALHMLAMARSFRTQKSSKIVQHGHDSLQIFSLLKDHHTHRLGIQRFTDNRMLIKLDGELLQSRSKLVHLLPVQLITPESIELLTGTPSERRQYLDWIMFHVEPTFHTIWSQYQRSLKQRNTLIREQRFSELHYWDKGIVEQGEKITSFRQLLVDQLQPFIARYTEQLLPGPTVTTSYRKGWRSELSLTDALALSHDSDITHKNTTVGPHRADMSLRCNDQPIVDLLSRGQLKLVLCALKLAQLDFMKEKTGKTAIVLVDDLPAELDVSHRKVLLDLLHDLQNQAFVSTTDRHLLDYTEWDDVKVFHVEHGNVKEVV